uniref:hypothetical protein n=1 Tax=Bartonella sp. AP14QHHD TaxID=3243467 RepID=UPI0035D0455F
MNHPQWSNECIYTKRIILQALYERYENVSNKSKRSVALTIQSKANAYSINICKKRSFYIWKRWFLQSSFS